MRQATCMYVRCQPYSMLRKGNKSFIRPTPVTRAMTAVTIKKRARHKKLIINSRPDISESCLLSQLRNDVPDEPLAVCE